MHNDTSIDKSIEKKRYDKHAAQLLKAANVGSLDGSQGVIESLRLPYIAYENKVLSYAGPHVLNCLELGSGTGNFTGVLLRAGYKVTATDISQNSLEFLKTRYSNQKNLTTQLGDIERMPFENAAFDLITSAGSLSYGDNSRVRNEVHRLLKPNGLFICVDSLNDNPIYRINRWFHYIRGNRTKSTLINMLTVDNIRRFYARDGFELVDIAFFGSISWAEPLLKSIFGLRITTQIINLFDKFVHTKRSAFKFVLVSRKLIS